MNRNFQGFVACAIALTLFISIVFTIDYIVDQNKVIEELRIELLEKRD